MENTILEKDVLAGLGEDIPFDELPKTSPAKKKQSGNSEITETEKVYPVGMKKWCIPPSETKTEKQQQKKRERGKKNIESPVIKEPNPSNQTSESEYLNAADVAALKTRIFENHEINMGKNDPMLVMVTIMDFYHSRQKKEVDELSSRFDKAMTVFENQSKNQLTSQAARDIHRLLREKKNQRNMILYLFVLPIITCFIGVGLAFYFYKPVQVGSQFLKIYPDLSESTKKEIVKKMGNGN